MPMLDFNELDRDLVDIFVEEGGDLLDHVDALLVELRADTGAREAIIGLQRDLHTLKGGARMAGIATIGDLGHVIESLLEAVAEHRTVLDHGDVRLLERGFDTLHQLLVKTRAHRTSVMPDALIAAFEARIRGEAVVVPQALEDAGEVAVPATTTDGHEPGPADSHDGESGTASETLVELAPVVPDIVGIDHAPAVEVPEQAPAAEVPEDHEQAAAEGMLGAMLEQDAAFLGRELLRQTLALGRSQRRDVVSARRKRHRESSLSLSGNCLRSLATFGAATAAM